MVRSWIASVSVSGAGPPFPALYLMPKSPSGPPGLWLADRMMPPKALYLRIRCEAAGVGVATTIESHQPLVAIPGVGVLIRDDAKPAIEPMGRCLADVMRRVEETDPLVALTDDDVDRLVNWDAEKYRQTLKVN